MTEQTESAEQNDGTITIEVASKKTDRQVSFDKSFGKDLEESVSLYGADVVHRIFVQQAVIKAQARVRIALDKGASTEDAVKLGVDFVPGVTTRTRVAKDPVAEMAAKVAAGEISQEDLVAQLEAKLAELTGGGDGE